MNNTTQHRLSEMRSARADFDLAWQRSNQIYNVYLVNDGNIHLPEGKNIIDFLVDETTKAFAGDVVHKPALMNFSKQKKKNFKILTKIYNQENSKINVQRERKKAIKNAFRYRFGVLFEGYSRIGEGDSFDGLITESVDPRDFFDDNSSTKFYDPTGFDGSKDCIRRRHLAPATFEKMFSRDGFNQKLIREVVEKAGKGGDKDIDRHSEIEDETEGVITVLEHWTIDKVVFEAMGVKFFEADNPYGRLPFVVFTMEDEQETKYPPSLLEQLAPLLQMEDLVINLIYEMEKLNIPYILADASTDLIDGQELEAGVINTVQNVGNIPVSQMIQEIRVGGATDNAYNLLGMIEDRKRNVAKIDTRSLKDRPDETLGQAKIKQLTQAKEIVNKIATMMQGAEMQRAMIRTGNIVRYMFWEERNVLVTDARETITDLEDQKGTEAVIKINPEDWKGIDYHVIVQNKVASDLEKQENRQEQIQLFQVLTEFISSGVLEDEDIAKAKKIMSQLLDGIIDSFDNLTIDIGGNKPRSIDDEIDKIKEGKEVDKSDSSDKIELAAQMMQQGKNKQDAFRYITELASGKKEQEAPKA